MTPTAKMPNVRVPKRATLEEYRRFRAKIYRPSTTIAKREQLRRERLGLPQRAFIRKTKIILGKSGEQIGAIQYRGGSGLGGETEAEIINTKTGRSRIIRGIPNYVRQEVQKFEHSKVLPSLIKKKVIEPVQIKTPKEKDIQRKEDLANRFLNKGKFDTEAERIEGQFYATGRRPTFTKGLVSKFIDVYGKTEGRKRALKVGVEKAPLLKTFKRKEQITLTRITKPKKQKPTKDYRVSFQDKKVTAPESTLSKQDSIYYLKEREKGIKETQTNLRKEYGMVYKTFKTGDYTHFLFDEKNMPVVAMVKSKKTLWDRKAIQPLQKLTGKIQNDALSGRFGSPVQAYASTVQKYKGKKGLPQYYKGDAGFVTEVAANLLLSAAGGYGASKLFYALPTAALTKVKPLLKGGAMLWVGGIPFRAVSASKGGTRGVVLEFSKDIGFLGGIKIGGIKAVSLANTKVTKSSSNKIINKYFKNAEPNRVPNPVIVRAKYRMIKTDSAKKRFIKSFIDFFKQIPPLGKRGSFGRRVSSTPKKTLRQRKPISKVQRRKDSRKQSYHRGKFYDPQTKEFGKVEYSKGLKALGIKKATIRLGVKVTKKIIEKETTQKTKIKGKKFKIYTKKRWTENVPKVTIRRVDKEPMFIRGSPVGKIKVLDVGRSKTPRKRAELEERVKLFSEKKLIQYQKEKKPYKLYGQTDKMPKSLKGELMVISKRGKSFALSRQDLKLYKRLQGNVEKVKSQKGELMVISKRGKQELKPNKQLYNQIEQALQKINRGGQVTQLKMPSTKEKPAQIMNDLKSFFKKRQPLPSSKGGEIRKGGQIIELKIQGKPNEFVELNIPKQKLGDRPRIVVKGWRSGKAIERFKNKLNLLKEKRKKQLSEKDKRKIIKDYVSTVKRLTNEQLKQLEQITQFDGDIIVVPNNVLLPRSFNEISISKLPNRIKDNLKTNFNNMNEVYMDAPTFKSESLTKSFIGVSIKPSLSIKEKQELETRFENAIINEEVSKEEIKDIISYGILNKTNVSDAIKTRDKIKAKQEQKQEQKVETKPKPIIIPKIKIKPEQIIIPEPEPQEEIIPPPIFPKPPKKEYIPTKPPKPIKPPKPPIPKPPRKPPVPKIKIPVVSLPSLPLLKKLKKKKKGKTITLADLLRITPTLSGVNIIATTFKNRYTGLEIRGVTKKPIIIVAKGGKTLLGRTSRVKEYKRRIPIFRGGKILKPNYKLVQKAGLLKGFKR